MAGGTWPSGLPEEDEAAAMEPALNGGRNVVKAVTRGDRDSAAMEPALNGGRNVMGIPGARGGQSVAAMEPALNGGRNAARGGRAGRCTRGRNGARLEWREERTRCG